MERLAPHPDAASRRTLFGTDEALPEQLPLRAGPLALTLRAGALHDLTWHGRPVWGAVTFPHRDAEWWTPPFAAGSPQVVQGPAGFAVEVRGAFATEPRLATRLRVEADGDGRLRVEAEAEAEADLATNRTGLCLVIPTAAAGSPCEVEHEDGRVTRSTLPRLVPPWPPFTGIRAFRHRVAPGCWARCVFEGDAFEFEDQRNNADLSFKIYSRSNMMPRPYRIRAGVAIRQALALSVEDRPRPRRTRRAALSDEPRALPRFGLAARIGGDREAVRAVAAALRPAFLHASLHADDLPAARDALLALAADGRAPLRLELTGVGDALPDAAARALAAIGPEAVAAYPGWPRQVEALRRAAPGAVVCGGTPHFFAQINRIEGLGPVDALTFTLSPLMHGAEDGEVMESPRSLPGLVATLARRWPGLPVHLGPSAIAMRASPLGAMPPCDGRGRRAMAADDPRARGLFGAAWALALAAACAEAGVAAATLMASEGPSGVAVRHGFGLRWFPAAAVLARLAGADGTEPSPIVSSTSASGHGLAALALRRGGARELLLANLGLAPREVALDGWAAGASRAVLDEAALAESGDGPPRFAPRPAAARIVLAPYAVASLAEAPIQEVIP